MKKIFPIFLLVFGLPATTYAASESAYVEKGNKLYKENDWENALQTYLEGLMKHPDSLPLNFNSGDTFYRQEDFQKSRDHFYKALTSENKTLEAKASYNIGNSFFKDAAIKEKTDTSQALTLLKEAQPYYQRAIELNPKDIDAKYNYEVTDKKIKMLLEKQKNEPQKSKEKSQEEQQKEKQQTPEQEKSRQEKNQGEDKKNRTEEKQQEKQEQEKRTQQTKTEKAMSPEEAKMLVNNYGQEGPRLDLQDQHEPSPDRNVDKDW